MNYRFYSGKNSAYFRHSSTAFISRQFWSVNAMRTWSPVFVNWISDLSKIHFMFSTFYWYKSKTYSEKVKPSNKEKKIVSYFQNLNCIKTKKIIIWNICRVSHKKLCRIIFIEQGQKPTRCEMKRPLCVWCLFLLYSYLHLCSYSCPFPVFKNCKTISLDTIGNL